MSSPLNQILFAKLRKKQPLSIMELYNDKWDDKDIASLARILKAISHPARVAIIAMLANGKSLTVTEIYTRLNADQSSVSHHLSILRDRSVLKTNRQGKYIFYSLKDELFLSLITSIADNSGIGSAQEHSATDSAVKQSKKSAVASPA